MYNLTGSKSEFFTRDYHILSIGKTWYDLRRAPHASVPATLTSDNAIAGRPTGKRTGSAVAGNNTIDAGIGLQSSAWRIGTGKHFDDRCGWRFQYQWGCWSAYFQLVARLAE